MHAVYLASGAVSLRSVPIPSPPPGYALVQVLLAGICNTDLELQRGYYGYSGIPGHEFVGRVVSTDAPHLTGRRVAGEINLACGNCRFCSQGLARHCLHRTVLGILHHPGAFAGYLTLPIENLHLVPDHVSDQAAVFIEPLAAACEILDQVVLFSGQPVAVLGDGKLGLLVAQVLHIHGAAVTLLGRHPEKLSIAATAGIATSLAPAAATRYPLVVECTGSAQGLQQAVALAEPRATIVMKSTVNEPVTLDMAPVIVNEISLVGSRCGRFEPAIQLLSDGKINLQPMISASYPLNQATAAFAKAAERGVLKVILRP